MDNIVIYGKEGCVYCDMAFDLAYKKEMYITVKKLDRNFTVEEFTSLFPFAKTAPHKAGETGGETHTTHETPTQTPTHEGPMDSQCPWNENGV